MIVKLDEKNYNSVENLLKTQFNTSFPQENPFIQWYVYEKDEKFVGFISYSIMYEQLELNYIYVDSKERRGKIASKMMDYMLKDAKASGIQSLSLEVNEHNLVAQELYKKFGFETGAIRKNYYGNENGLLMIRKLI